jgi:CRP-like cAMP-binding protein
MTEPLNPGRTGNRLLDRLPHDELGLILPALERVTLRRGLEVVRQDDPPGHVYFPTSSIYSLVVRTEQGRGVNADTIGNEGMVGLAAALALDFSPDTATAQVYGESLRMPVIELRKAMGAGVELDRLLRRYSAFSLRLAHQAVACNLLHSVEQRMGRWLLKTQDRVRGDTFLLTHEALAEMLGARRQTVTVAAGALQAAGLISYRRGVVRVLDRDRLRAVACECYGVMRELYERLVGAAAASNGATW